MKSKKEKEQSKGFFSNSKKEDKKNKQSEVLPKPQVETQSNIENLQQKMQEINGIIQSIPSQINQLKKFHNDLLETPREKEQRKIEKQINELTQMVYQQAKKLIELLKEFQYLATQVTTTDETVQKQITQCMDCYKTFQKLWSEFYEAQDKFSKNVIKYNQNYFFLLHPDATVDELNRMPMLMTSELSKTVTLTPKKKNATAAMERVQKKYEGIKELSNKLSEVEKLFVDFALLTKNQTETVNAIQKNIASAKQSVIEGNKELSLKF